MMLERLKMPRSLIRSSASAFREIVEANGRSCRPTLSGTSNQGCSDDTDEPGKSLRQFLQDSGDDFSSPSSPSPLLL